MTATVSTKKETGKINPAFHNWKSSIRDSRKFSTILFILHLVAAPAVLLAAIISIYSKNGGDDVEMYAVIAVCTTALAAFLGIFAAVDSFRCLHDKSVVDMKLALPLNNTQRFFSNFLSGLFTYLAPFLSAQVLSVLLCGYGLLFMDGKTFYRIRYEYSGSVTRPVEVPYICDVFGEIMPILLKLIVGGTLCMLMLYVITVLITICCGNKFEAIAYTILINVLIPATIFCVFFSMYENLYGIEADVIAVKIMLYISVAGGVLAAIDWATQGDMLYGEAFFNHGVWLLVFALIIAALFALSFFLYRKRRAEQVSKPFVFKLAYYIVVTCAMFCIISCMMDGGELVPTIIISGIIYMIFEVVTNRGFKKFWLSAIKYAATFIAVVALITIGEKTDGFGAVQRVPSVSAVRSIELDYGGFYEDFSTQYDYYTGEQIPAYIIRDKENIETVINAHQAIIDFYNENRDKYDGYGYFSSADNVVTNGYDLTITYRLKTGGSFTRTYYGYSAKPAEILTAIDLSEEYRKQAAENYREYILNTAKYYEKEMARLSELDDRYRYDDYTSYETSVYNRAGNSISIGGYTSPTVSMESLVARDFFTQLADAYYKDIMAITEENYFRSEYKNVWNFFVHFAGFGITVPESFTNTVQLLEYFDFGLIRIEDYTEKQIYDGLVYAAANSSVMLFTEDEYRAIYGVDGDIPLHADYTSNFNRDYQRWKYETFVYNYDSDFIKLVKSAMPRNIIAENGYVIYVSGFTGAVPEDMYGIASSVKLSGYDKEQQQRYHRLHEENTLD